MLARFTRISAFSAHFLARACPREIYCAAEETISVSGKPTKAFRYDENQFGGVTTCKWITADHRLVKMDYGGPTAELSTREAALENHPQGVSTAF